VNRHANRFRPALEQCDERVVPSGTTYVWQGYDGNFDNPLNWYALDTGQNGVPGAGDELDFDGVVGSTSGVSNFHGPTSGSYAIVALQDEYDGTVHATSGFSTDLLHVGTGSFVADGSITAGTVTAWGGTLSLNATLTTNDLEVSGSTVVANGSITAGSATVGGGTLSLNAPLTSSNLELDAGTIDQPTSGADVTVTGNFTWTGGTFNSTSNLANVNISGNTATATFAPTNGGTVNLGSNINLSNGATATMSVGTINITNDSEEIDVGANCGMTVDPGSGLIAALTSPFNTRIQVEANGSWTVNRGTFSAAGMFTNDGGTFTLKSQTSAIFPGLANNSHAYVQNDGATYLYGSQGSAGLITGPKHDVRIRGGMLDAIFDDGQSGYPATANILTDALFIEGGDIYINYVPGVLHTVYGELFVTGKVDWVGGTYHPFVEGNVNAGNSTGYSDFWSIGGTLFVGQNAALDPTSVVGGLPASATSGYQWTILFAGDGINAAAGTHPMTTMCGLFSP
jgi:hypothetical protein